MEFGIGFSHRQATFLCHSTKVNLFVVEIASSKKVYGWPQPLRLASHSNLISTTADMKRNISRKLPIPNCRHCEFPYLEQRPISHYHSTIRGPVIANFHVISVDTISALPTDTSCTLLMDSMHWKLPMLSSCRAAQNFHRHVSYLYSTPEHFFDLHRSFAGEGRHIIISPGSHLTEFCTLSLPPVSAQCLWPLYLPLVSALGQPLLASF
jgi:hypothetical protein